MNWKHNITHQPEWDKYTGIDKCHLNIYLKLLSVHINTHILVLCVYNEFYLNKAHIML